MKMFDTSSSSVKSVLPPRSFSAYAMNNSFIFGAKARLEVKTESEVCAGVEVGCGVRVRVRAGIGSQSQNNRVWQTV